MSAIDSYPFPRFMQGTMLAVDSPGYQWRERPPIDLQSDEILQSANPWYVLAAVFERAKHGDHGNTDRLLYFLRLSNEASLTDKLSAALGVTAPRSRLRMLRLLLGEKDSSPTVLFGSLYSSLVSAYELWVVPELLEVYLSDRVDEFSVVSSSLSEILEDAPGQIAEAKDDDRVYRALVMSRFEELRDQLGTDEVAITRGRPVEVDEVARRLRQIFLQERSMTAEAMYTRMLLEAFTGLDCRAFYKGDRFQPLSAVAVLENFLDHADLSGYRPGVRYFFGHPVPAE